MTLTRCPWCAGDAQYTRYHDEEWGVELKDSRALFELLVLEQAQAGLSWKTILHRRAAYRRAFDNMNPERIARYTEADCTRLMQDAGIIRNRRKISAAITAARQFLAFAEGTVSFADWLWDWVDGTPIINTYRTLAEIPPSTALSQAICTALKQKGFTFIGPTSIYAFMQSAGLVNDHLLDCFRHPFNGSAG